ncbi:SO_0444 family Cu/Zn efflux transporter [Shewanella algae]|uniref:Permease n=1 Tax=Shewanella algae TaxID=38313 RepID=A0AAD1KCE8_9GAMM|nr:SO_0444 family Cu/Zn efflux transporter [Shewanella algae]MBO2596945.1 SO_0444 family Cu/Zn efflux transporter [Shewanella algae]BCV46791.1 permease [Shewanella algae]
MLMDNFIELFLESAPWLLLGLVLAGLLKVFVPMSWMQKQLGGHGLKTTVKAALLGAPLPLCSCGVIPAAVGLRRSGASKAATTSFLVSTPETGVDSVTVSYVLLGPFMAIVRPIAAVCSAIVAGLLVGRDDEPALPSEAVKKSEPEKAQAKTVAQFKPTGATNYSPLKAAPTQAQSSCCAPAKVQEADCCSTAKISTAKASTVGGSCCSSVKEEASQSCCSQPKVETASCCSSSQSASSCCDSDDMAAELKSKSVLHRVLAGLKYAATDLVRDTAIWLLVGLFFAALVQTYVPGDFLAQWGGGILAMLVMVLISIPMYICATASTPIAAGLLLAGVSPGAVLVFMLAGPATNIATLGVVAKEMGKRALYGYLGGVLGVALLAGMLVNLLVANFGFEVMPQIGEEHQLLPQAVVNWSGIILALLMAKVIYDKIPRRWLRRDCCSG